MAGRLLEYVLGYVFGAPVYAPRAQWRGALCARRHADRIARFLRWSR